MKINNPANSLSTRSKKNLFVLFLSLTTILFLVFGIMGKPLNTEAAPSGIISFELAGRVEVSESILTSWNDDTRTRAAFGLGLDFLFIPVYAGALILGCALSSRSVESRSWPLAQIGNLLAWGVCLAGFLDVIENIALLRILFGEAAAPWPEVARFCAIIKFSLIFAALVFTLYGWVVALVIREE